MYQLRPKMIVKRILFNWYSTSTLTIDDIPRRKSLPLIGTMVDHIAAGGGLKLHEYVDRRHKQLGPVFREKLGSSTDLVFVSDPMLIRTLFMSQEGKYPSHILPEPWVLYEKLHGSKRGLFFMNGEEWLQNRRVMNKYFLKEGVENWLEPPVKATVSKFIEKWRSQAENGFFTPDLESDFYRLSIDVIIAVMLGTESNLKIDIHNEALVTKFSESVKKIFQTTTKLYALPVHLCQKLNLKVWKNFEDSVSFSIYLAHKIVGEILNNRQNTNGLIKILADDSVKDEDIQKIIGDFVIAAGDTTSYTSLWSLYLLSKHEDARKELCVSNNNSQIHCVIKESMRLYPVAPFITRILPKECELGSYKLDAGTPVLASIYTSGRDKRYFSRANEFLPYRWNRSDIRKKELENHISFASLPFALGARSCIGKKLAMLQMTELIKQIVENFEFKCINTNEVTANTSGVLVPNGDIKLMLTLKN